MSVDIELLNIYKQLLPTMEKNLIAYQRSIEHVKEQIKLLEAKAKENIEHDRQ